MLKDFFTRELDGFKADAAAGRAESREDHRAVKESIQAVDEKVDDVRERVTRLEASSKTIGRLIGGLIAGTPVLFLIFDRITH
jgi:tetrahydromethanopterin S-methyltransferase subunit G